MKRSKHEIISKILKICLNGASKTRIVYQANLNFRTVNPYLQTLIQNNLLEADVGERIVYRTTKQGANLEETISHVNHSLLLE
ncbi:MAG TPA: winged helix-turn-helix domain-containing protein [Methanothrix sp.]|nr:winged helix-turn-helix domain-containing protein [Methanothrix sp.]